MMYYARGSTQGVIDDAGLRAGLLEAFQKLGKRGKVLAIPPDFTRFHSKAGRITEMTWEHYGQALTDVLPALGTHFEMTDQEKTSMFGTTPKGLFRVHKWRDDVATLGRIPGEFIKKVSEGRLSYDWPAQVNKLLVEGGHDLILSVGQVVPHEVMGMAGYNKNIFVGTGGREAINKSHYIGAVYGMERMMGRADTPVRAVLNKAAEEFTRHLPIVYVLTVVGREPDGSLALKGLYVGDDHECFHKAADLSLKVNFTMVEAPLSKVVVYLDPSEFKSTWLGNKSIYRTRMAIADGGELIVLGPGVKQFGEDPAIDGLIRKYGYHGTPHTLKLVDENDDLRDGLGVAAHLIHGSSEGRFSITYCAGGLTRAEVETAGFQWADLAQMSKRYDPARMREGWNDLPGGERVYYISNPAIGLWSSRDRFKD
jgi:nickel-dependent lactate racemase